MKILRLLLLFPIGTVYGAIALLRRKLYNNPKKRFTPTTTPIISIGNLAVGGTGKTPHTEYLIRILGSRYRVSTLSRGYKRHSSGYVLADETSTAEHIGDEPMQMHLKYPDVTVAVCESRREGIERLLQLPTPPEVILLDDGYQHLAVKGHLQILLTDFAAPYYTDFPMPAGNLREFRCAAKEADVVIVTKCPSDLSMEKAKTIQQKLKILPHQKCYFSTLTYGLPQPLTASASQIHLNPQSHIILFTGISHPESAIQYLSSQYTDVKSITFSDHHQYSEKEISKICQNLALSSPQTVLMTTEKDAARLKGTAHWKQLSGLPLFSLPITVKLLWEEEDFADRVEATIAGIRNSRR